MKKTSKKKPWQTSSRMTYRQRWYGACGGCGEATDSGTTSEEDSDAQSEIDVEEDSIDEAGDAETTETSADPLQTALEGYDWSTWMVN